MEGKGGGDSGKRLGTCRGGEGKGNIPSLTAHVTDRERENGIQECAEIPDGSSLFRINISHFGRWGRRKAE